MMLVLYKICKKLKKEGKRNIHIRKEDKYIYTTGKKTDNSRRFERHAGRRIGGAKVQAQDRQTPSRVPDSQDASPSP
jgi:hypothetical protein